MFEFGASVFLDKFPSFFDDRIRVIVFFSARDPDIELLDLGDRILDLELQRTVTLGLYRDLYLVFSVF